MTIRRICIENYRSIENLDVELSSVNALVGPNNSGKSNILRALNIVLGETWPTKPFTDKDYFQHDLTRTIHIQVFFQNLLQCDHDVEGFWLKCAANQPPEFQEAGFESWGSQTESANRKPMVTESHNWGIRKSWFRNRVRNMLDVRQMF